MLMPTKNRLAIYAYLFNEGVLTAQKDVKIEKHHILDLPNLHVVKVLQSLKSMGHVREVFSWQWHYYFLTEAGVAYLRNYLNLPEDVIPETHKKVEQKVREGAEAPRPRFNRDERKPREQVAA